MDGWMDETWKEFILKWFRSIQSSPIFLSPFIFYFGISSSQIKKNDWGSTDFSLHVWLWCHNERGKKNKRYDDSFLYICMCIHTIYTYMHTYIYVYVYCGLQNTINQHYFYSFVQGTLLFSIHFCQIKRMSNSVREKMVKGQCRTEKLIGISFLQI